MSYIRSCSEFRHIKAENNGLFVFKATRLNEKGEEYTYIEDYGAEYSKEELIEIICLIVERETQDQEYTKKINFYLKKYMGLETETKNEPTLEEKTREEMNKLRKFNKLFIDNFSITNHLHKIGEIKPEQEVSKQNE